MQTKAVIEIIMQSDAKDWNDILLAVVRRHKMLYPDWELHVLSQPKSDGGSEFDFMERYQQI